MMLVKSWGSLYPILTVLIPSVNLMCCLLLSFPHLLQKRARIFQCGFVSCLSSIPALLSLSPKMLLAISDVQCALQCLPGVSCPQNLDKLKLESYH